MKKAALPVEVKLGQNYAWCRCGLSQTLPLCDGSHKNSDKTPLLFTAEQTATVYLCSCYRTQDPPYCDGINCDE